MPMSSRFASVRARSLLLAALALVGAPAARADAPASIDVSPRAVLAADHRTGDVSLSGGPYDSVDNGADRSGAPYLFVAGGDSTRERLPLKETSADVTIAGVIARVKVSQVFENNGRVPIEATYVFPGSTRAAVQAMRMRIGGRTIEAHIDRKEAARATYETARHQGRRASLLEQERPNVFTMNVANVMPGDRITVELDYSEMLVPEDSTYEFVVPTVVGPRYTGGSDPARDGWMANSHTAAGAPAPFRFDVRVHLETGVAVKEIGSPSHKIVVRGAGTSSLDVALDDANAGNRDFVLRYRLAGDRIETGALVWKDPAPRAGRAPETFFAMMMEPPRRPVDALIPPREYIFLLDVSGSMQGYPLDTAKALMRELLTRLRPSDTLNLALFSGASFVMSPDGSLPATPENVRAAIALVDRQQGGGGTELMGGLTASYGIPKRDARVSRTIVVVTDGYVGVEAQAFRFIREHLGEANLFSFGIGSAVNRALIEGMARAGMGEPFVVLRQDKAPAAAARLRTLIERPVLTDIHVEAHGLDLYDVAPEHVPDLMAARPLVVFGKIRGSASGSLEITGSNGAGRFTQTLQIRPEDQKAQNAPLRALWARTWIDLLEDERHLGGGKPIEDAITNLGLGYSLLTAFTSFVAVDSAIANHGGALNNVRQPLPLPEGVSEMALGGVASLSAPRAQFLRAPMGRAGAGGGFVGAIGKAADLDTDEASPGLAGITARAKKAEGSATPAPIALANSDDKRAERKDTSRHASPASPPTEKGKTETSKTDATAAAPKPARASFVAKVVSADGVDHADALKALVEARLAAMTCGWPVSGRFTIVIDIDARGVVLAVRVVGVDDKKNPSAACLGRCLFRASSAARARGDTGRVTIEIDP